MKNIYKIISLTGSFKKHTSLNVLFNFLGMFFALFSFAMIIPLLRILFSGDNLHFQTIVDNYQGLQLSSKGFQELLNYKIALLILEEGKLAVTGYICTFLICAISLKNICIYLANTFQNIVLHRISEKIRSSFYSKIMSLNLSFFADEKKGDLLSRATSDVREVELAFMASLSAAFKDPFYIIGYIITLFAINSSLSVFIIVFLPVAGAIIGLIGNNLKKTTTDVQAETGNLISQIEESIGGLRIVKAFNAEQHMQTSFNLKNSNLTRKLINVYKRIDLASPVSETLGVAATCGVLLYGGNLVIANELDPDYFIGYLVLFSQLITPIKSISKASYEATKGVAALERINEIIEARPEIQDNSDALELETFSEKIDYKNISFKYDNAYVLNNINITIKQGQTIALVGQSGSGKSTLADLLPRFYDVKEGEILIDGNNVKDITMRSLRKQLGIVTQQSILFNDTIFNNIALGIDNASLDDVINAAKIANAHEFIENLENGYQTNIGDSGDRLSGGQKQRISIARAILKNPPILLLDEATSALDTESEKLVQDALNNLMQNRTSLVIAHRLSTIQHADNIIVLENGLIIEQGTHEELLAKKGTYNKLHELQTFK